MPARDRTARRPALRVAGAPPQLVGSPPQPPAQPTAPNRTDMAFPLRVKP